MNRRIFFEKIAAIFAMPAAATAAPALRPNTVKPAAKEIPPWLRQWQQRPRFPVLESLDDATNRFIQATHNEAPVAFFYHAGRTPGERRLFTPSLVFHTEDNPSAVLYVTGWCHTRNAHRTLRLDRIALGSPQKREAGAIYIV